MQIETDRLLLREFKASDWKAVHEYARDPEVSKYMLWGPNSVDDTLKFVDERIQLIRKKPRTIYDFAIILKASNTLIGTCGLTITPDGQGVIGYCLNRNHWRQGYGSEACQAVMEFGFSHFKLHRIHATCDADNVGSAGVLSKVGMRQEAHFLQNVNAKGKWRDTLLFAILRSEWEKI
jgi:RimJ/RimL family protein N-acetyltransferase